jgi:hypothetical protein
LRAPQRIRIEPSLHTARDDGARYLGTDILSFTRKPGAATGAAGGSHEQSPAQSALVSLLEMAYGSAVSAEVAIAHALSLAGRDELPAAAVDVISFARAHLTATLTAEVGPRLTMALLDDLVARLEPSDADAASVPPVSMPRPVARVRLAPASRPRVVTHPRVVLVDADRVGRTVLARAMVRADWEVTVVESVADLAAMLASGDPVDAAIVDAQHPSAHTIVEALAVERPGVTVVARSADAASARALLTSLRVTRQDVRSRDAPPEELIEAVRRAMEGGEKA